MFPQCLKTISDHRAQARADQFAKYARLIKLSAKAGGELDSESTEKLSEVLTDLNMPIDSAAQDHADLLELVDADIAALDLPAAREAYEASVNLDRDTSIKFALDREALVARMRILSQHGALSVAAATEMQVAAQNLVPAELNARKIIQDEGKLLYRKMMIAGDADARAKALRSKLAPILTAAE